MQITVEWLLAIVGTVAAGGIIGLIQHMITDEGTRQRLAALEQRTKDDMTEVRTTLNGGILPRTAERLQAQAHEIEALQRQIDALKERQDLSGR